MKQRPRIYYSASQRAVIWERWRKGCQSASKVDPVSASNFDPRKLMSEQLSTGRVAHATHTRPVGNCGDSVTVLEPPGFVAGLDDVAVMGDAIQKGRGHLLIVEHLRPLGEREVGGDDHRDFLVEAVEQVE